MKPDYANEDLSSGQKHDDLMKSLNFIRTWSYDIGSYMGMMRSLISLLDDVGEERLPELAGLLHTTRRLMEDIHENIKEFTRGKTEVTLRQVDLGSSLKDLINIYRGMAESY